MQRRAFLKTTRQPSRLQTPFASRHIFGADLFWTRICISALIPTPVLLTSKDVVLPTPFC